MHYAGKRGSLRGTLKLYYPKTGYLFK